LRTMADGKDTLDIGQLATRFQRPHESVELARAWLEQRFKF